MCRAVRCKVCGKTTWSGCGQHVGQVMTGVPRADRCLGHTDEERAAAGGSLLGRLFGRG
jgi:hypothetical protein